MAGSREVSKYSISSSMLDVNVRLASNIGLEEFWSLHDSGISKTHTRRSGQDVKSERGLILANGQGQTTNDGSSEDDI